MSSKKEEDEKSVVSDEKEKSVDEYVDIGINITSDLFGMQRKKKKDHWEDVLDRAVKAGVKYVFFFFRTSSDQTQTFSL